MKRAILEMPARFLHYIFIVNNDYHIRVEHGLPEDAKFMACYYDHQRHVFQLLYESKEFEDIPEGDPLPTLEPVVAKTIDCQEVISESLIPQYES